MGIDYTKPLQILQNGRKLRLLCTDAYGPFPVICLTEDTKEVRNFTFDGRLYVGGPVELMNVPEQVTVDLWVNLYPKNWVNIYPDMEEPLWSHPTKEKARFFAGSQCIATIHIKRTVPVGHVDE